MESAKNLRTISPENPNLNFCRRTESDQKKQRKKLFGNGRTPRGLARHSEAKVSKCIKKRPNGKATARRQSIIHQTNQSAMQHTKGSWKIGQVAEGQNAGALAVWAESERFYPICLVSLKTTPEDEANAKLIAAAPDLLKAAQDIRKLLYELGADDGDVLVGALSQAIAKATT